MLTIRAMSDGKGYSARHLERDYYAEGERVVGEWFGRGAELVGLSGVVMSEDFEAVGRDSTQAQKCSFGFAKVLTASRRTARSWHRDAAYTISRSSAPKSVSVVAILGDDHRLIDAHQTAVRVALQRWRRTPPLNFDSAALTRTAPLEIWSWPCIITTPAVSWTRNYTHAVAANLSFDGAEGRWKALQASDIYERRAYLTEVYRNALAREVRALGYQIDNRRDSKGRDSGFEIRGVSARIAREVQPMESISSQISTLSTGVRHEERATANRQ